MEPISTAIIAALVAGVGAGVKDTASKTIGDAYEGLKSLLRKRFGQGSRVVDAVEALEAQPDSAGRREVVREEVEASGAADDAELITVAMDLLEQIGNARGGEQHIQQAVGNYIAQADRGGTAQVHVRGDHPPETS